MEQLKNRNIVLTGASGLLGKAIKKELDQQKANVIAVDIRPASDEDRGTIICDMSDTQSVKRMLNDVLKKYKRIDGLINNAYPRTSDWGVKFEHIPYSSWQQNIDTQLNAVFFICQQVLEQMKLQGAGSVINIGSIYGMGGPDFSIYEGTEMTTPAAYSAIKGGIINFSRYLASYYGKYNIRINTVSPGGIFDNQPEQFVERYVKKVPLGRMAVASDIAPTIAFLLSDGASYITGQNLVIDGGWTAI